LKLFSTGKAKIEGATKLTSYAMLIYDLNIVPVFLKYNALDMKNPAILPGSYYKI
jgi:hypothetical protein